jgi:hypothetical protein
MKRSILFLSIFLILFSSAYIIAQSDNNTQDNSSVVQSNNSVNDNHNQSGNINNESVNLDDDNDSEKDDDNDSEKDDDYKNRTKLTGNWTSRCQAVNHRVEGRLREYNEEKDNHHSRFSKLSEKLQEVITKADAKGFDTSALKEDQTKLNELIQVFQQDYALFMEKLANTRNFTCGHSEGQFASAINESKNQLKVVKLDAEAIKDFFQSTVKEDIKALKDQEKLAREERKKAKEEELSVKDTERQVKVAEREVKRLEMESKLEARKIETQAKTQERENKLTEAKAILGSKEIKTARERVQKTSPTDRGNQ